MSNRILPAAHASNQRLILYALGQSDAELAAHLTLCAACRAQGEAYQAMLAATRETLSAPSGKASVVSCENRCLVEGAECVVSYQNHALHVVLTAANGTLSGRLIVAETCTCWVDAPVRLFGPNGLVASSRVDANGAFELRLPANGKRYSLGLVLTRHGVPELQIIGDFDLR